MKLFAGIDAGQSSTIAVVGDVDGRLLGRGVAGPADEVGCDAHSTRLKDALEAALAAALDDAELPRDARLETVVAGITGYTGATIGAPPKFNAADVRLMHDAPIAHAGALDVEPGVIAIAGTGSVVYGIAEDGRSLTMGGWGYLFGDEGSAFWIGKAAIVRALEAEESREACEILDLVREHFAVATPRDLVRDFYAGKMSRDVVAAFAPAVLARESDATRGLVFTGVVRLIEQIALCIRTLNLSHDAPVALVGGLSRNEEYVAMFEVAADALDRPLKIVRARADAVTGALTLARPSTSLRHAWNDEVERYDMDDEVERQLRDDLA